MTLRKGMKVEIWAPDKSKLLGIGTFVGMEKQTCKVAEELKKLLGDNYKINMPKFKLGRKIYYGSECWWITVAEANKIKKEFHFNL